jgi:signal transduction histidine kinase
LSALTLTIKAACEADTLPPAALGRLEDALRLAGNLSRDIHELATRLRPAVLDAFGLHAALRQLLTDWSRQLDIKVDFEGEWIKDVRFAADIETALYRVAQEALTNVARHANAKHGSMIVELNAGDIIAVVEDDGRGFDASAPALGRMGLEGMRERATLVGGTFDIESIPGIGTTVIVSIPVGGSVP